MGRRELGNSYSSSKFQQKKIKTLSRGEIFKEMRTARSRRVQAQRKFAQGAYVPPNVVAVVAADNRRDGALDPKNVTINNMTATGLLDVVSLQSRCHLTSQLKVIVERLPGVNTTRDVLPATPQRKTVETRSWEYPHERVGNNITNIKKPAEPPTLQTVKKKKEYKKEHPMALRCRRQSKLQLNKLIAESCAPLRKVSSKRKKNTSDDDEPLIYQKTRLMQIAEQLSTSKQTAVRKCVPKKNILKPSSPTEKSPKNEPCKKRSKTEITTSDITTNEISLKETDRRNAKQSIARKKTPVKKTQQKRIHKKCSPEQPARVAPEFSIPDFSVTVIKKALSDETEFQDDTEDLATPDESIIEVVPNDPLPPDVPNNLVAPVVPVATDDLVTPRIPLKHNLSHLPILLDDNRFLDIDITEDLDMLDEVLKSESVIGPGSVDEPIDEEVSEDSVDKLSSHDEQMINDHVPEDTGDVQMTKNNFPEDNDDIALIYDDALEDSGDVPKDNVPEDTRDVPKDNVPEDTGDLPKDNVPEDTDDAQNDNVLEETGDPDDINFVGREVNLMRQNVNLKARDREVNLEVRHDLRQGRNKYLERHNNIPVSRRISESSDSIPEVSDATTYDHRTRIRLTAEKRTLKHLAVKKRLDVWHERMRQEKEREVASVQEQKRQELPRNTMERECDDEDSCRHQYRIDQMDRQKKKDLALLTAKLTTEMIEKYEAKRSLFAEIDGMAAVLEKEKDAKSMDLIQEILDQEVPGTSNSILPNDGGFLVEAPIYHPTEEDFRDPLSFYESIWSEAARFGICKVVPPPGWRPPIRVHDDMRFDVMNQYISRLFNRWGPAARELCAIKLSLAQQNVNFTRPPLLDGVEVNLPKLYHLVQRHGGLERVYNKKRWGKVAEDMKFNKGPNTERKLDQIYVKYLLPYDTLSHQERQDIMRKVEIAWNRKNQKLLDRALNPLKRQQRMLGLVDSSDDETEDEDTAAALNEAEDCITKGAVMNRAKFRKIATMAYENTFGHGSEAAKPENLEKIEELYWRLVTLGTEHVCVHTAAIDTGEEGYGFAKNMSERYGRHPWNPKMVSQNPRNVLHYLGQMMGVTMPTLLLGMLFSTSCWHKDPHIVAWLEYLLFGPERIWYAIPADQVDKFRKAVETLCPTFCQNKTHWLPTDVTMIPPNVLREHNVTLSRVTQRDGEYILAFPNAYTCSISTGYTESESVYFAPPCWLESLWKVFKEARESCEPTMFAMEHLLYNIGKDPRADPAILKLAQPLFDKMLREEVTNRQMLQERGLPFEQELLSANSSASDNTANEFNPRDQDECEYCRASLYLSKVKGLTERNTVLCLEHALKLLDTEKYKDTDVNQLQVLVHVSVKELNTVHDDMKRRLGCRRRTT